MDSKLFIFLRFLLLAEAFGNFQNHNQIVPEIRVRRSENGIKTVLRVQKTIAISSTQIKNLLSPLLTSASDNLHVVSAPND